MRRKKNRTYKNERVYCYTRQACFLCKNCCVLLREDQKKLWNFIIFLPAASRTNKDIMFLLANILANKDTTVKDTKPLSFLLLTLKLKSSRLALSSLNIFVWTHIVSKKIPLSLVIFVLHIHAEMCVFWFKILDKFRKWYKDFKTWLTLKTGPDQRCWYLLIRVISTLWTGTLNTNKIYVLLHLMLNTWGDNCGQFPFVLTVKQCSFVLRYLFRLCHFRELNDVICQ